VLASQSACLSYGVRHHAHTIADAVLLPSALQVFLPFALVQLGNAMVSMRRLNQYLVMEERTDEVGASQTAQHVFKLASLLCVPLSRIYEE
jgi:hypothetical protein